MTHINKQKFLTELSKFLTFLNDEEREKVLEKFEGLFDHSDNEEELIASMESPLKITVELSRAFTKGGLPEVLSFCEELVGGQWTPSADSDAVKEEIIQSIDEDTFKSIDIVTENAPEAESEAVPSEPMEDDGLVAVFEQDMKEEEEPEEPAEEVLDPLSDEEVTSEEYTLDTESEPAEESESEEVPAPEEEDIPAPVEGDAAEEPESEEEEAVIEEPETPETVDEEVPEPAEEEIVRENPEDLEPEDEEISEISRNIEDQFEEENNVRYKAKIWALIPYLIIAIPLGLIGIVICAAITGAILAVAAALVAAVVTGASMAAQSGMNVMADIIMTIGATLIALGLALLVIWFAVWFAVNTIGGIIGGLCRLGRKWCYKEVVEV